MTELVPASLEFWLPIGVFILVFAGIFLEYIDKAIVTTIGAFMVLLLGSVSHADAFESIDFETLALLFGMMIVVEVASRARLFELLSVKILKITAGRPLLIFLLFIINTLFLSSFLNNVTTILIILPLTIEITRGVGLNTKPFVIGEIVAANIGGLLTLIGDPVNTIVGTAVGLGMLDFLINLSIPVFLLLFFTLGVLLIANRKDFKNIRDNFVKILHNILVLKTVEERFDKIPLKKSLLWTSSVTLVCTIAAFIFSEQLQLSAGVIALIGATVSLTLAHKHVQIHQIISSLEWQTLFFFGGLFVVVGALESTGALEIIANALTHITTNPYLLIFILLIGTGVVSAIVDNVPFVTMMIPIMQSLLASGLFPDSPEILWWTLSLGAVMGGMASPYGSTANIVAIGTSKKAGLTINLFYYLRYSLPISCAGLLISYVYLISAYEL